MNVHVILAISSLVLFNSFCFGLNDEVNIIGRFRASDNAFDWSGVQLMTKFTGTTVSVTINETGDKGNYYAVFIDDMVTKFSTLVTQKGTHSYSVADGLRDIEHDLLLVRQTEAMFGISNWIGLQTSPDQLTHRKVTRSGNAAGRSIEFIGDSVVVGYGDLGKDPCNFSQDTESILDAYGPKVALSFGAEFHVEAWSGKGVVRNYGDKNTTSPDPFPIYWNRTLANDKNSLWDFDSWVPQVVVIHLGGNDFSTKPHPPDNVFSDGYYKLLSSVFEAYHSSPPQLFHLCGPMWGDPCDLIKTQLNKWNSQHPDTAHYVDVQGIMQCPQDCGCNGHPNVKIHDKMADALHTTIAKVMGW